MEVLGVMVALLVAAALAGIAAFVVLLGVAGGAVLARARRPEPLEVELDHFLAELLGSPLSPAVTSASRRAARGARHRPPSS